MVKRLTTLKVDFRLTTIKPLHDLYNFITTDRGVSIINEGWKKAGIAGLLDGTTQLPPADPFDIYI